ncbi:cytidine deaminase [Clostridium homopropionicum DSM 5847]|uniref:Cytidine deaminase n=1 Tax=Clostridium homopropionicum DSM 5847 TaxID=1121318 RepID=A0A0L6ZE31_9CLOT|nr:cytidine deaminase [Clostridium homopropionicum]KOA21231.1 cytidine deaminase [Clostridium homopropionicum DSM 5847]SFG28096.1 cytidine deaminase [Clostridium homopropionicum]
MKYNKLIKEALKYRERAYVPYSKFKVGAAVLMEDENIYGGCNIENASFGATNCAERTAIFKAVAEGNKKLKAIAVVGDLSTYTSPCGICRQVISEFGSKDTDIILVKSEEDYIIKKLEDMLPKAFTKEDLEK